LVENNLALDLKELITWSRDSYQVDLNKDVIEQVSSFIMERFKAKYQDEGITPQVVDAVTQHGQPVRPHAEGKPRVLFGIESAAAQDIRTERVAFPAGASGTAIEDSITGRESVSYVLGASAGQTMSVRLTSANTSTYFNVYAPGRGPGDEALAVSEITGPMVPEMNRFEGTLPASGDYIVSVYLYRNAARAGQTANYTLEISIGGAPTTTVEPAGDFADGMTGGPDFWEVTGLAGDGPPPGAGFDTLEGVRLLLSSPQALLAGWVHYLVFDLWVGSWETEDNKLPHWLLLPCLLLACPLAASSRPFRTTLATTFPATPPLPFPYQAGGPKPKNPNPNPDPVR
jgi:hypothetical protein